MYNDLPMFQPLYANGLIDMDGVNTDRIENISFAKLLDIYDEVSNTVSHLPEKNTMQGRIFCASNSLSGAPYECMDQTCRVSRVEELSKFSSLFADNVIYHNFLADISPSYGHAPEEDNYEFRYRVASDLLVLYQLKDLIASGIVQPYTTPQSYCLDCFSKEFLGNEVSNKVKNASNRFKNKVYQKIEAKLIGDEGGLYLSCEADETIFAHGTSCILLDDSVKDIIPEKIINQAYKNGVYLNDRYKRELKLGEMVSTDLMTEAVYQKSISKMTGGSLLTHSSSEIGAMRAIEGDSTVHHVNNVLSEHWNIIIPYAEQISVSGLLKLREREGESFVAFRKALDKSVSEAFQLKGRFNEKDARDLFSDMIEPQLAQLELKTKMATKDLVNKPLTVMAGIGAAIGVGAYTGLLTGDLATAVKALGLGKTVYDGVTSTIDHMDITKEIKQEDYYYLWKMSKVK